MVLGSWYYQPWQVAGSMGLGGWDSCGLRDVGRIPVSQQMDRLTGDTVNMG